MEGKKKVKALTFLGNLHAHSNMTYGFHAFSAKQTKEVNVNSSSNNRVVGSKSEATSQTVVLISL